uniref:Phenol 2-monooxygenase-like n=1 Tax=Saccoglossus kowalevskii TaxID=10224 RepID=A0ABM0MCN3_SACKO|nr:PREDICTED: phenol 2-monooxygenase-like [Saccoglossus kowalevskii]
MTDEVCDVIISGYGPVGVITANLLGRYGLSVKVFERDWDVYNLGPRAVAIDSECTRIFGMFDLDTWLDNHVIKTGIGITTDAPPRGTILVNGTSENKRITEEDRKQYGYQRLSFFNQPLVERRLREHIKECPNVKVFLGHEIVNDQHVNENQVEVQVRKVEDDTVEKHTCKYLLVCEGGRSETRKRHGLKYIGSSYKERWLVLDTTHNDQKLKERLKNFWFVTNSQRVLVLVPLPDNTQRFEYLLNDDEDSEKSCEEKETSKFFKSIEVDPSKLKFKRRIVYTFHARQIEHWTDGNVIFLGDAAHCTPPFRGQGLCTGIKDAANLAWKLTLAVKGNLSTVQSSKPMHRVEIDGQNLLQSFERERCDDVWIMTMHAITIGKLLTLRNPLLVFLRNVIVWAVFHAPITRQLIEKDQIKPCFQISEGILDGKSSCTGSMFPQPKVFLYANNQSVLLDKVLGNGFSVLMYNRSLQIDVGIHSAILQPLNAKLICVYSDEISARRKVKLASSTVIDVVDTSGELGTWFGKYRSDAVIVRPDRIIFGHCKAENINYLIEDLGHMISGKKPWGIYWWIETKQTIIRLIFAALIVVVFIIISKMFM